MSKVVTAAPWSYSKLKSFETCPKQFYHVKVVAEYPESTNEAMFYGNRLHKASELYVRDREELGKDFEFLKPTLDSLMAKGDSRLCEYKMGLTVDLEACGFFSPDVWWRGIIDLLILDADNGVARVVDYKSGKDKYADVAQLELMAMAVFKHFPAVKTVKGALLFVVAGSIVSETYKVSDEAVLWDKWNGKFSQMNTAFDNDVWNPNPSGLCYNHCPVLECPHNGRN